MQGDCLTIRCANPAEKPARSQESDPLRAHGLGLGILNTIASKYRGTLKTQYVEGTYRVFLCLPLPKIQEGAAGNAK